MDSHRSVLLVDPSEESRTVLRTVLERRGVRILEASRADRGLELARSERPDLIVLDLEVEAARVDSVSNDFDAEARKQQAQLIVLGTAQCLPARHTNGRFVAKPYHYAPLVRKIETLLAAAAKAA